MVRATRKPRVLVTGSSGLLGRSLMRTLKERYEVLGVARHTTPGQSEIQVDITQRPQTVGAIVEYGPQVIVHAAAQTDVDLCETERDLARRINVEGTANVASGCAEAGAKLLLVSTDYVFDGAKGSYVEHDQPNPVNFYGQTKLEAERIAAEISSSHLIMRTSVLYGWHPTRLNFATRILSGLREHKAFHAAEDHFNSPTLADNLAEAIRVAIERGSEGILHVAGKERISRYGFARKIAKAFSLDEGLVVPVMMRDLPWVARRPRDSSLRVEKAEKELGIELFDVEGGLREMARSMP